MTPLETPIPGARVTETHLAVDPADPARLAAAAMLAPQNGVQHTPRSLALWLSNDAGGSWEGHRVTFPRFDMEGAFDPLVAFTPEGTCLVAGMAVAKQMTDAISPGSYVRDSIPSAEEQMAKLMADLDGHEQTDNVTVVRHRAEGAALGAVVIEGSRGADKPALAVDSHAQSPHRGTVYVAWHDMATYGTLRVARSTDDGRTFSAPVQVVDDPPWGNFISQLAVRPDGSLHIVWTAMISTLPTAPPEAATSLWHSASFDGGVTFTPPTPIAQHAGLALIGIPAMGMAPDGSLLVVLGQGEALPADPVTPVRHRLFGLRSADGRSWSEPTLLCPDIPPTTSMGLPAVAGDGRSWWILTYLATDDRTEVALLRADHDSDDFHVEATLAARPISVNDIYLHGGYQLIRCADVVRVGDYVGLAAHEGRVTACFVLPESDEPLSTTSAYTAVLDTGT